ncbi:MAG: glucose-6-phosphate dehydrogenase (NADP(+)) [Candidatus Marinimicrobia bacterium]|nr:glucose-6-phosphate dehydrogenase (NADP(+)) [Candidatus Neomarinimicrobiota bacterium]
MKHYTLVIFGGTGDLTKRKLIPAIQAIADHDPETSFNVLGIGRKPLTDESYREFLQPDQTAHPRVSIHYMIADIETPGSLDGLMLKIGGVETAPVAGRIYYLATSYSLFGKIAKSIHQDSRGDEPFFTRIIAEKPFGNDRASFKKLNRELRTFFSEDQIYRADHYLAKGTIDNILRTRFSNPLFESVWNSRSIARITVAVNEALGVGNRIGYYDQSGAIKDMVQNHLLQTLSLVLMNSPARPGETAFRKAKTVAIKKLYFRNEIRTGQYRGYQKEVNQINPGSRTETFVDLSLYSKARRWKGTEIVLRTGKMLKKREAFIDIEFRKEPCTPFCSFDISPNRLTLHIQPLQNVELAINTTLPGEKVALAPVKMTFCPTCEFTANTAEGYEVILRECLRGDKRLFMCDKELDYAWRLSDTIRDSLKNEEPQIYEPGSEPGNV